LADDASDEPEAPADGAEPVALETTAEMDDRAAEADDWMPEAAPEADEATEAPDMLAIDDALATADERADETDETPDDAADDDWAELAAVDEAAPPAERERGRSQSGSRGEGGRGGARRTRRDGEADAGGGAGRGRVRRGGLEVATALCAARARARSAHRPTRRGEERGPERTQDVWMHWVVALWKAVSRPVARDRRLGQPTVVGEVGDPEEGGGDAHRQAMSVAPLHDDEPRFEAKQVRKHVGGVDCTEGRARASC